MGPKRTATIFVGATLVLMLPYMAYVLYFSRRFQTGHWPIWFSDSILIWFAANFIALTLLATRLIKRQKAAQQNEQNIPARSKKGLWIIRIVFTPLVILWSIEFLRGAKETMQGELSLDRAIPAGAFLLFFIVIFGWTVYRAWTSKA